MDKLLVVIQILALAGGASAFLFVIWPAIRRQNRIGQKMEDLLDNQGLRETIAFYASFAPGQKKETPHA